MLVSESIPKVYAALAAVQKILSVQGITKSQENKAQGFKFRGIDDVLNALSTALVEANVVILPAVLDHTLERYETEKTGPKGAYVQVTFVATVKVQYTAVSPVDGSTVAFGPFVGMAFDQSDKAYNKALAAAYKYMAFQSFCIPLEGMDDADSSDPTLHAGEAPQEPPKAAPSQTDSEKEQLFAEIRGAGNAEDLRTAFGRAWNWSRIRKDGVTGKEFQALYESRKGEFAAEESAE